MERQFLRLLNIGTVCYHSILQLEEEEEEKEEEEEEGIVDTKEDNTLAMRFKSNSSQNFLFQNKESRLKILAFTIVRW
jgi:hypothetical protein